MVNEMLSLLHGLGGMEYAHALARVSLGAFFAISGANKLANPANLLATFAADHIPLPRLNRWLVPSIEFSAGCALVVGFLTPLASLGLLAICLVATCTDGLKRFTDLEGEHGLRRATDWLDDLLYLPEVLYIIMLLFVMTAGAGPFSVDALI